jgi:RNA polymerase sigma-70 factor (ECF subfamily)
VDDRRHESEVTDGALVGAARAGDQTAFEALMLRHENRVLRLLRLLGVPAPDQEDVAQEIFVRVFRHLRGFRPGRSFSAWVYRITLNAAHDHRRSLHRRGSREGAWDEACAESPDRRPGAVELLDRRDARQRLEGALERLSERERAVFVLCEMEELTTREVARALGINAVTVRRHLGRARQHLRLLLTEQRRKSSAG